MRRRMQSYVYRVTHPDTGEFYIGCRSVPFCMVEHDEKYKGLGVWPIKMAKDKVVLSKKILAVFDSLKAARQAEKAEIKRSGENALCRNRFYLIDPFGHRIGPPKVHGVSVTFSESLLKTVQAAARRRRQSLSYTIFEAVRDQYSPKIA